MWYLIVSFPDLCHLSYFGYWLKNTPFIDTATDFYPPTSLRDIVLVSSVHSVCPSVHTFCLSGTIFQYLLGKFDSFLVQMISTLDYRYPISLVKIDPFSQGRSGLPCEFDADLWWPIPNQTLGDNQWKSPGHPSGFYVWTSLWRHQNNVYCISAI